MQNRIFFPQLAVDTWGIEGKLDLVGNELIVVAEGRKFKVTECVYVTAEVTGANDEYKLVGRVRAKTALDELGAEILENSMILGDNAYDVIPGWAGTAAIPLAAHVLERTKARGGSPDGGMSPRSEEEWIRAFIEENS